MKTEDPLIHPYSPGECLARLARVRGVLLREEWIGSALPAGSADKLQQAFAGLSAALESGDGDRVEEATRAGGECLQELYDAACQPGALGSNAAVAFEELGFSNPLAESPLAPVDVSTVVVTHCQPERQVMTTIAFEHSPGAKAYRLLTTRFIEGEDVHDDTITCLAPVFRRMRIPAGVHRLRIESRDLSGTVMSEEFSIEVPKPS